MKKILIVALALVMAVSLTLVPAAVSANPGPPTIDGVISAGEWTEATAIAVTGDMGTVYVLAYTDYLYVLFNVKDSTDARKGENIHGNDQTSININPTPGAAWGKPCDIIFQMGTDPAAWGVTSSGTTDGWATDWEIDGVQQMSLPGDLKTMTLYDGTRRISEWKLPLASIAPSHGDTLKVGGAIDVGDGSSYVYPVGLDWGDAATYVGVTVQPATVTATADINEVLSISVTPTLWDFGTISPGTSSAYIYVTVTNTGTVPIKVTTELKPAGTVFDSYLYFPADSPGTLVKDFVFDPLDGGEKYQANAQLKVPRDYPAKGVETATIIFWATAK